METIRTQAIAEGVAAPRLKRELGLWTATALVIGNMVGSGIFLLPSSLAATAGPASILAWVFTGIGAMLLALVFARLGRAYPKTGGPYVYVRRAFGDFMGFWTAWSYWINAWTGNAAIAIAFAGYLVVFWPNASTYWVATLLALRERETSLPTRTSAKNRHLHVPLSFSWVCVRRGTTMGRERAAGGRSAL